MPGEFDLITRHFCRPTPHTHLGPGDDCALLCCPNPGMELAVTTDALAENTHFLPDTDPHDLGWKVLAVSLSDLAAMGAKPRWALLCASFPVADENWIAPFAKGFHECAQAFGIDLIGGDTVCGARHFSVTAIGEIPAGQALRRSGAKAGDDIWVSGQPGLAALGLKHLEGTLELPSHLKSLCIRRLQKPTPRISLGLSLVRLAHAAIDISDGLLADLGHIAKASFLDAHLYLPYLPRLPEGLERHLALDALLAGGDDYELCFTAPAKCRAALSRLAAELDTPLWRVGLMEKPKEPCAKVRLIDPNGEETAWARTGFSHFS